MGFATIPRNSTKRIDGEHRLIYRVEGDCLVVAQAKGHYE
ncbi:MAG: type II toxin-antitoxin system YoeB family toxin [Verrucomicrobia bacterium]|nr:type II toxin-antitoxin system YoeB family toxin [Verrucomicrobiota bacterium]